MIHVTHPKSDVLYKVFLIVWLVLLDVGQGVLIQVFGHSAILHPLQDFSLEIQQQIVYRLLLLGES